MLFLLSTGFISWWGTGVDDTLALSLLLKGRRQVVKRAIVAGTACGVLLVLLLASAVVAGIISLAPGLLDTRLLGVPAQNLLGLIPIAIGARALIRYFRGEEGDDDDSEPGRLAQARELGLAFLVGMQVYVLNASDDLTVHLGILGGALQPPLGLRSLLLLGAYWAGNLGGALTSIVAATWLAHHMQTRRRLELLAALFMVLVGLLVVIGVFEQIAG